ncbi:hypothetical protein J25TS5_20120 [Paenibacillus faecis]|nr:hypothetical protein J25TS5_20120 [Paenibacillus faecis]
MKGWGIKIDLREILEPQNGRAVLSVVFIKSEKAKSKEFFPSYINRIIIYNKTVLYHRYYLII